MVRTKIGIMVKIVIRIGVIIRIEKGLRLG